MPRYFWEREILPVFDAAYVVYGDGRVLAIATDADAAQKIVDALNNERD